MSVPMCRTAFLFPGQGAQFPGMAQRWYETSAAVRDLFALAEEQTGLPLRGICFTVQRDVQARTDWTQPAVLVASIAGWYALRDLFRERGADLAPAYVAGHSLGHFTALVATGVLDLVDALRVVHRRGQLMSGAARERPGAMATVIGLPAETSASWLDGGGMATQGGTVVVAAVNGPDQVVISGDSAAVRQTLIRAEQAGASRVVPLAIGVAAHSPLMAEANRAFAMEVAALTLTAPRIPVVLNTTGRPTGDVDEIRTDLLHHMVRPVLWWDSVSRARAGGVARLVDVGPGRTLRKVLSRDLPDGELYALDHPGGPQGLLP
jgi:[acyl-carrier-protein] S-malonyltransferase